MSHFFAILSRMKFIRRWGLMHSHFPENVQEHSLRVAIIAHALAVIRNRQFAGNVNAERVATMALYHDASEVLTGDLPTPVKYKTPQLQTAYKNLEATAAAALLDMLPAAMRADYRLLLCPDHRNDDNSRDNKEDREHAALVHAADKLCAYIKCLEETRAGNVEFREAEQHLRNTVESFDLPEVTFFVTHFLPGFSLTLDELQRSQSAGPGAD